MRVRLELTLATAAPDAGPRSSLPRRARLRKKHLASTVGFPTGARLDASATNMIAMSQQENGNAEGAEEAREPS